jgi:hypothetical protein
VPYLDRLVAGFHQSMLYLQYTQFREGGGDGFGSAINVRFEVFTAVTMKNVVFWDVAPCRSCVNRRFGGTYRLHLQGIKIQRARNRLAARAGFFPTLQDGGDMFLRNVGLHKIYTAPHPRRRHSSMYFNAYPF